MIRVCNLSKKYGKMTVLKNLSFAVDDEEFVAITGESGKGKTAILNLIGLLDTEYYGKIEIDGKNNFSKKEISNMQRYEIAYLFQNYALVENETVEQNLMIALYFRKGADKKKGNQEGSEIGWIRGN